ncbi:MAG: AAA family ATPase, partial [Planctomycetes bacterium]|nr:AAA family ATPase [Planctomycetota bacterium]
MYCGFFGLRCPPFEDRADPQFTYATSPFEEALAALEYEAHFGQGMTLALGEAGTGKTQLIRSLLMRLHSTDHAVVVTWPVGGEMDLVRETCKGFGVTLSSSHGSVQQPARLRRHLSRHNRANHRSILIIDQAENMTADNLLQLGTLADLEGDTGTLLNILLVGQPQFRTLMNRPEFARLRQQLFGERTLSPLTLSDTTNYLRHRLSVAGAADPDLFDDQAVKLIHQAAGGIPRLINRMADAALIAAYGAQAARVNSDIAAEVTRNDTILERSMDRTEVGVATGGHLGPDRRAGATAFRPAIETAKNLHGADSWDLPGTVAAASDEGPTVDIEDPAGGDFPDADEMDSSSYAPLLEPVDSFHAKGEALLERLQRALARAERFSATSNASLSQFTAVEKHLHSLTTRAERLIDRVGGAVRHGSDSLDQQQSRVGQAVHAAQRHATRLDGQLSRAAEIDNDMKEHIRRLERACERADQVESRV